MTYHRNVKTPDTVAYSWVSISSRLLLVFSLGSSGASEVNRRPSDLAGESE